MSKSCKMYARSNDRGLVNIPANPGMVFTYLHWCDMLGFVHPSWTLCADSVAYPPVFKNEASNLRYSSNQLINSSNVIVQQWLNVMLHYENKIGCSWLKSMVAHWCTYWLLVINVFIFLVCNASCQITYCFWIHSLDRDVPRFSLSDWCVLISLI